MGGIEKKRMRRDEVNMGEEEKRVKRYRKEKQTR